MHVQTLLDNVAASGSGTEIPVRGDKIARQGPIPVHVFGTSFVGTVILEGTIAEQSEVDGISCTWSPINGASWTNQNGICEVLFCSFTHIRANVTVYTSGNVTVKVWI